MNDASQGSSGTRGTELEAGVQQLQVILFFEEKTMQSEGRVMVGMYLPGLKLLKVAEEPRG